MCIQHYTRYTPFSSFSRWWSFFTILAYSSSAIAKSLLRFCASTRQLIRKYRNSRTAPTSKASLTARPFLVPPNIFLQGGSSMRHMWCALFRTTRLFLKVSFVKLEQIANFDLLTHPQPFLAYSSSPQISAAKVGKS